MRAFLVFLLSVSAVACASRSPGSLMHEAYVWQHAWGPQTATAVRGHPAEVSALHVLAGTFARSGAHFQPADVDVPTLAQAGPVVAVVRVEGAIPPEGMAWTQAVARVQGWQEAGVQVHGIEVDDDCPTRLLPRYVQWLTATRASTPWPRHITALPTWLTSPALPQLVRAADAVTLQVHAIRIPALFDPAQARAWAQEWSEATQVPFRVALPTYSVQLESGPALASDPRILQQFVRDLQSDPIPGLTGIVWFRLPFVGDPDAWPAPTWRAVLRDQPLLSDVRVELRTVEPGLADVVATNRGTLPGPLPPLHFTGEVEHVAGVRSCTATARELSCPAEVQVAPAESVVVGYVRGRGVAHVVASR